MDLSILIPARNEMFIKETVDNILANIRGKTEIIVVLDGAWADPGIDDKGQDNVTILYRPVSVGQRAATNDAARLARGKYVMKIDAHCAVDEGFDVKMMKEMKDDYTMIPVMQNLHVFDWECEHCDWSNYQGKERPECPRCGNKIYRRMIWKPRNSPRNAYFRFDKDLHFQYWGKLAERPGSRKDVAETLTLQGSCFMLTKKKYFELGICDEGHGSWGQQGVEVACKTWLSGGRLVVNKKTWYAHLFRTQGGDFGFPYPNPGVKEARKYSKDLWFNDKWPLAKHKFKWLLDKFAPVPEWHTNKGIIYYTDNRLRPEIAKQCREQLLKASLPIVSASLEPIKFGKNIHIKEKPGYLTMFKQILAALGASESEVIFFAEHDVIYHPSHFDFTPPDKKKIYYNTNVWKVRHPDGHAIRTEDCRQVSGICAYRDVLIRHYKRRVAMVEENGYSQKMGFEPGTHNRDERVDDLKSEKWESKYPNLDIRHDKNLSPTRWKKEQFRNKKYTKGWKESQLNAIPGWDIKIK